MSERKIELLANGDYSQQSIKHTYQSPVNFPSSSNAGWHVEFDSLSVGGLVGMAMGKDLSSRTSNSRSKTTSNPTLDIFHCVALY